jgi:L-alanine-DL-glutamate epimerase-like enolase superfamily enzyme
MKLLHDRYTIHPKAPFSIARSSTTAYDRVRVRLIDDAGTEGWGEAAPNVYYKESVETVIAALPRLEQVVARSRTVGSLHDIDVLEEWMRVACHPERSSSHPERSSSHPERSSSHPERSEGSALHASARAAVSSAAHDLLGKKEGKPVWKLFGLEPMHAPPSSYTIAIPENESDLVRRVEEAHRYPILKVKLGTDRDEWIVRTVKRVAPDKLLRVDANAAWKVSQAIAMSRTLAELGVELLEQPVAAGDIEGLRQVTEQSPIPVIADESCVSASDIPRLADAVHGINIKLSKCGGLAEARRMAHDAERADLRVMLGCMIESSLGISALAQLAPLADYADLDGAALLSDDPFLGVSIEDGFIKLSDKPGLGVSVRR